MQPSAANRPISKPLYTASERLRRDSSIWTTVQGVLAPAQFLAFAISLGLVLRYLATGNGYGAATVSILVKAGFLYAIMVTGAIWEKVVFGQYLFAPAFFWEDVFSFVVIALHTAYVWALLTGSLGPDALMALALAAYATYAFNAGQFLMKLRRARLDAAGAGMTALAPSGAGLPRRSGAERARPARGVLRPHRHHLAAPQDPGRVLPRRRQPHLRAPAAICRRGDDLRRAALRHRHPRGKGPCRPGGRT